QSARIVGALRMYEAVPWVAQLLDSRDRSGSDAAARALGRSGGTGSARALIKAITRKGLNRRLVAELARAAPDLLVESALAEPQPQSVRPALAIAAGLRRRRAAVGPLIALLENGSRRERVISCRALGWIGARNAHPTAKVSPEDQPADDAGQKSKRLPTTVSTAKAAIFALLVERHADEIDITDREGVRSRIASLAEEHVKEAGILLNRLDYGHLLEALLDEVLGLGPLQVLLDDPKTTEIMVNNPHQIYVERAGRVSLSPVVFESAAQMRQVIDRIVSSVGRRVDESSPMVDARLRDGSRVNVVLPPLAI